MLRKFNFRDIHACRLAINYIFETRRRFVAGATAYIYDLSIRNTVLITHGFRSARTLMHIHFPSVEVLSYTYKLTCRVYTSRAYTCQPRGRQCRRQSRPRRDSRFRSLLFSYSLVISETRLNNNGGGYISALSLRSFIYLWKCRNNYDRLRNGKVPDWLRVDLLFRKKLAQQIFIIDKTLYLIYRPQEDIVLRHKENYTWRLLAKRFNVANWTSHDEWWMTSCYVFAQSSTLNHAKSSSETLRTIRKRVWIQ